MMISYDRTPLDPSLRLGFVGSGNMAGALLRGLEIKGVIRPSQVILSDIHTDRAFMLAKETGARVARNNAEVLADATVILLAVKPQGFDELAQEIQPLVKPHHLVISILAGTPASRIEASLAHEECPNPRVIQVMPNTPALIGQGSSGLCAGPHASEADLNLARRIFDSVGVTVVVRADQMNAVTGLSGTGPAYVYLLIEALLEAAKEQGFSEFEATTLVKQMVVGAALMARDGGEGPEVLRARVTSKGGTTERGIAFLEKAGFRAAMRGAVNAATERAKELSGG